LRVLGKLISKIEAEKITEIMPGFSSVATKIIASEINSSSKVKQEIADIWINGVLLKYFTKL